MGSPVPVSFIDSLKGHVGIVEVRETKSLVNYSRITYARDKIDDEIYMVLFTLYRGWNS